MPAKCVRNIKIIFLRFLYSSRFWYKNYLALMHRYKALVHRQNLQERKTRILCWLRIWRKTLQILKQANQFFGLKLQNFLHILINKTFEVNFFAIFDFWKPFQNSACLMPWLRFSKKIFGFCVLKQVKNQCALQCTSTFIYKRVGRYCQNCILIPSRHDARRVGLKRLLKSNKKTG